MADRIYMTRVNVEVDGDTLLPALDESVWREIDRESHQASDGNDHDFDILTYSRIAGT